MDKYAIIKIGGTQYKVSEGDELIVDKLNGKPSLEVLLFVSKNNVKIGKPALKDVKVKFKIIQDVFAGKKIYVQKFKAKSRYRRKIGFRPLYSKILIEKIS